MDESKDAEITAAVASLVEVAALDTVYGDVYLRRARELLGGVLSLSQYRAREQVERDIAEAVRQSKVATMLQDWQKAAALAEQAERMRREAAATAALSELGAKVYDAAAVAVDPFSPGFEALPGYNPDLPAVRDALAAKLAALERADAAEAGFYRERRAFFTALTIAAPAKGSDRPAARGRAELEQLAEQAAARGDMAQLKQVAQEILTLRAKEQAAGKAEAGAAPAGGARLTYRCPVDLGAPFPAAAIERARGLGLTPARTEPLPQWEPLFDFVTARVFDSNLAAMQTELEGAIRAEALVEQAGLPADLSEPVKVLVGQFLRNPFVSSGGARYLPLFRAEAALIEDFAEEGDAPQGGLIEALELPRRHGLSRREIDEALLRLGGSVLSERLQLDAREYRLVCIPEDLYMRFGRERGWGQWERWTHLDGYQVLRNGELRALVGGNGRYGGLSDLASIAVNDRREAVLARFAVIRRARQVARWR